MSLSAFLSTSDQDDVDLVTGRVDETCCSTSDGCMISPVSALVHTGCGTAEGGGAATVAGGGTTG